MNQLLAVVSLNLVRGGNENIGIRLLTRLLPPDLVHAVVEEWMPMETIYMNKLVDAKASVHSGIGGRRACHDEVQRMLWTCNERSTRLKENPDGHLRFLASNKSYTILLDNADNTGRPRHLDFYMTAWVKDDNGYQIVSIRVHKVIHPDQVCNWLELNFVNPLGIVKWTQGSETYGVRLPGVHSVMFRWRNKGLVMRDIITANNRGEFISFQPW